MTRQSAAGSPPCRPLLCHSPGLPQGGFLAKPGPGRAGAGRSPPTQGSGAASGGSEPPRAQRRPPTRCQAWQGRHTAVQAVPSQAGGQMRRQITPAKSSARVSDAPNRVSCSPALIHSRQRDPARERRVYLHLCPLRRGDFGIVHFDLPLRHLVEALKDDTEGLSHLFHTAQVPAGPPTPLRTCVLRGGHPMGQPRPHRRPTEEV